MYRYQELANAIVAQAVYDYADLLKKQKKRPDSHRLKADMKALNRFFHSQWYATLTAVDPDVLLEKLKKEAENA